jgi:hypothetical protein
MDPCDRLNVCLCHQVQGSRIRGPRKLALSRTHLFHTLGEQAKVLEILKRILLGILWRNCTTLVGCQGPQGLPKGRRASRMVRCRKYPIPHRSEVKAGKGLLHNGAYILRLRLRHPRVGRPANHLFESCDELRNPYTTAEPPIRRRKYVDEGSLGNAHI